MKNLIKVLMLSVFTCFMTQDAAAQSQSQLFQELYKLTVKQSMNYVCLQYNSTTIRKNSNQKYPYSYTGHGAGNNGENMFGHDNKPNILSTNLDVAFSDRNWDKSKRDKVSVEFALKSGVIKGTMTLVTWGNKQLTLTDVRIKKVAQGYIITAQSADGRSTSFYNFAVHTCHNWS